MKIVYISNLYYPLEIGGAEIYLRELARNMSRHAEVAVVTATTLQSHSSLFPVCQEDDGVHIYRFFPTNLSSVYQLRGMPVWLKPFWHAIDLWNIHAYFAVLMILKLEKPDIVHTHNISGFSTAVFRAAQNLKIPVIHTLHDYQLISPWAILFRSGSIVRTFSPLERLYQTIKRVSTKTVQIVTAPSKFVLDLHRKYGFFPESRFEHVPLGISVPGGQIQDPVMPFTVLCIGQIAKHKGVDVLIRAIRGIPEARLRLIVAGTGPDLARCRSLAEGDERISFAGFVRAQEKERLFQEASITAVPSVWYDNSPVSIYESFQHKRPVIASRIGGIPELVHDGVNGVLVPPADHQALGQALFDLSRNQNKYHVLQQGCERSLRSYSFSNHMQTMLALYQSLFK